MTPRTRVVMVLALVGFAFTAWLVGERILFASKETGVQARAEALRDRIRDSRPRVRACLEEVERLERSFREQETQTEVLRLRVEAYEEMDARGVPADRYDDYMAAFEMYNESLPEWERRAAAVARASDECRRLAEDHNRQADSLRLLVVETGLWEEEWLPDRDTSLSPGDVTDQDHDADADSLDSGSPPPPHRDRR